VNFNYVILIRIQLLTSFRIHGTHDAFVFSKSLGVRSDSFTNVGIFSPNIQRNIIAGKDINLATLLMPNYEAPQTHSVTADETRKKLCKLSKPYVFGKDVNDNQDVRIPIIIFTEIHHIHEIGRSLVINTSNYYMSCGAPIGM
jgi:hypothetical protein